MDFRTRRKDIKKIAIHCILDTSIIVVIPKEKRNGQKMLVICETKLSIALFQPSGEVKPRNSSVVRFKRRHA